MENIKFAMTAIVALMMWSCGAPGEWENVVLEPAFEEELLITRHEPPPPPPPSSPSAFISSSAAVVNPADDRQLLRTANIRFRVNDVIHTTFAIENIVLRRNGFVEFTHLESRVNRTREIPTQRDSAILITHYTVTNELTLRVPSAELDATLREIAQFVRFMDFRTIEARDIRFDVIATQLEQARLARFDSRLARAVDNQPNRELRDIRDAENLLLQQQARADRAKVDYLRTLDLVDFSAITLSIYQNQSVMYETVAREKTIRPYVYSEPFGTRFVDALVFGWDMAVSFFLFLVHIWSVILVAVLVFFGVRYFRKRFRKKNNP